MEDDIPHEYNSGTPAFLAAQVMTDAEKALDWVVARMAENERLLNTLKYGDVQPCNPTLGEENAVLQTLKELILHKQVEVDYRALQDRVLESCCDDVNPYDSFVQGVYATFERLRDWSIPLSQRTAVQELSDKPPLLPDDVQNAVLKMGPVEWGATEEKSDSDHLADFESTLRITRDNFKTEGDQRLHGLYLRGTETVLCHTGTSPNSPVNAKALAGAWNWLHEQAVLASTPQTSLPKTTDNGGV